LPPLNVPLEILIIAMMLLPLRSGWSSLLKPPGRTVHRPGFKALMWILFYIGLPSGSDSEGCRKRLWVLKQEKGKRVKEFYLSGKTCAKTAKVAQKTERP
jgi:hypothetical protein